MGLLPQRKTPAPQKVTVLIAEKRCRPKEKNPQPKIGAGQEKTPDRKERPHGRTKATPKERSQRFIEQGDDRKKEGNIPKKAACTPNKGPILPRSKPIARRKEKAAQRKEQPHLRKRRPPQRKEASRQREVPKKWPRVADPDETSISMKRSRGRSEGSYCREWGLMADLGGSVANSINML